MTREEKIYDHYTAWAERLGISLNGTAEREVYERVARSINSAQVAMPLRRGATFAGGGK